MTSDLSRLARRQPLFVSAKTTVPIPVGSKMRSEALLLTTFDPAVAAMDYLHEVTVQGIRVPLAGIVLSGDRGRELLELPDDGPTPDFDEEGLRLLAIEQIGLPVLSWSAADLARQPRAGNVRLAWRARKVAVGPDDRIRILAHLEDSSPARLIEVASTVRASANGVAAVLALACQDLVELDLESVPLGPWTTVRRRRRRDVA